MPTTVTPIGASLLANIHFGNVPFGSVRFGSAARWVGLGLLCGLLLAPVAVRADGEAPHAAPRTAVQIGDASVVLIAANDRLYAFVDRIEDNAPLADADLIVASADGTPLAMVRATDGLFAAPFPRGGRMRDAFVLSLRSPAATGDARAEIAYDDLAPPGPGTAHGASGSSLGIAIVSGSIGALGAVMAMLWLRGGRRRPASATVGTAQAA
ncbi:MAG: hypothetical protein WDN25_22875 [Acetobacteraceae bacterium]